MVLDAALLSTQLYKVRIKGKVEQYQGSPLLNIYLGIAIEKELSGYHIYQPLRSGRIWHKVNF